MTNPRNSANIRKVHDRAERMRKRIEDAIMMLGHRDWEAGQKEFVRRAILVGKAREMRMWRGKTQTPQEAGMQSLRLLFGEITARTRSNGKTYESTGHNAKWVLDLWDAVLEEMYYKAPGQKPGDPVDRSANVTPIVKPEPEKPRLGEPIVGPPIKAKIVAPPEVIAKLTSDRPLTMRLLEAYTSLDSETFMTLLLEVERLNG